MSLWQRVSQAVQAFALTQKRVPTAFASTLTLTGREPVLKLTVPELVGDAGYAQEPCSVCPVQKGTESQRPLLPDSHNYHEIRLDAGLTARALSAAAGWHEAKTSRIESAQQAVSDADIQPWCQVCGAGRQAPDLMRRPARPTRILPAAASRWWWRSQCCAISSAAQKSWPPSSATC